MNEAEFHKRADAALRLIEGTLEAADEDGAIDVEYQGGILTITLPTGKQFIVSKHAPSMQLWLSSPVSGGLHFSPAEGKHWKVEDGRTLEDVLTTELFDLAGLEVIF